MKKNLFVTIAALATVITCAQYPVVDKTYPTFSSAAVDTKGNLFVVQGFRNVRKISTTGTTSWFTPGWYSWTMSGIAIDSTGAVYTPATDSYFGDGDIFNSFSGQNLGYLYSGHNVTSCGQVVSGADGVYHTYVQNNVVKVRNFKNGTTYNVGAGMDVVLEPCATGGVFIGIRGGHQTVVKVNKDMVFEWAATDFLPAGTSVQDALKLTSTPSGGVIAYSSVSGGQTVGVLFDDTGSLVDSVTVWLNSGLTQEQLPKPLSVGNKSLIAIPWSPLGESYIYDVASSSVFAIYPSAEVRQIFQTNGLVNVLGPDLRRYSSFGSLEWTYSFDGRGIDEILTSADGSKWAVDYDYQGQSRAVRLVSGPKSASDTYVINEDTELTTTLGNGVLLNDSSDVSGGITAEFESPLASAVGNLTSTDSNGTFTFRPAQDMSGVYEFYYRAKDANNNLSARTLVRIVVRPVNDKPVSQTESYNVVKGQVLNVNAANGVLANDTDADGDNLIASLVSHTTVGQVTLLGDGSFAWQAPNRAGTWTFRYRAYDGKTYGPVTTVTLNVTDN